MIPLSLYALSGLGCAFLKIGEIDLGIKLFTFIQQHPQTPPLYIDLAHRWYQGYRRDLQKTSESCRELGSLEEVIEEVVAVRHLFDSVVRDLTG
jgi:hypothetical protein